MPQAELVVTPSSLNFGSVAVGKSQSQAEAFTNEGDTSVTISQVVPSAGEFTISGLALPVTRSPGNSVNFSIVFTPKTSGTQSGNISASASVSLMAPSSSYLSSAQNASLISTASENEVATVLVAGVGTQTTGTGTTLGQLTAAPASLSFGSPLVGSTQSQSLVVTNAGTASVTITQAAASGTGYKLSAPTLPLTLAGNQTASFSVTFAPLSAGTANGSVSVVSNAANPTLDVVLSATPVTPGVLAVSTSPVAFGTVTVGSTQKASATLTNSGGSSITLSQAAVSGNGFSMNSMGMPMTLAPNQSANVTITCAPQSAGALSGSLSIASDASNANLAVPLTAMAVAPGALTVTPSSLSFGSVQTGTTQSLPATLTNSGGSSVTVTQATFSGSGYSVTGLALPMILSAGQSVSFNIVFAPQSAGTDNFGLSITSNASNPTLTVPLAGSAVTPGSLTASAPSLSFGNVQVGSTQTLPETVTNSGGSNVTLTQATAGSGYTVSGLSLPLTLAAGQSTSFNVAFSPQSAGSDNLTLAIANSSSIPTFSISLTGTAVTAGTLSVSPTSFSFGSVNSGSTQSLPATLTNSGGSSVTITQATFSGSGYSVSGLTLPLTLQAGNTASFNIVFAPQAAGTDDFSLSISSNASNPTLTVPVSGSATTPGALTASAASLSFGQVTVGSNKTLPETLTNSGGAAITLSQVAAGAGYSVTGLSLPVTLNAGQSTSFNVAFAPTSAGNSNVNLAITNNGPSTFTIPLSGSGVTPGTLTATSVSFGSVQVGSSSTQTATLTNSGGASLTVSQATLSGTTFTMSGLSLPLTLSAGQSFTFSVTFTPQSAGSATNSITLVSNASGTTPSISLSGTGTAAGQLSVNPGSLSFGSVEVGASKSMPATLSATGSSVTVTSASVNSAEFTLGGLTLPLTIPAGGTASLTLTFTPQASGAASATVSFATSASGAASESASGTGTAPIQHSVALSWSPSTSSVSGYNVYRGSTTGGPYAKLTSSVDGSTTYTDTSVQAGDTYYYVTTSVGTDGTESSYSNQVSAVIPTP